MLYLVLGRPDSGKSKLAEELVCKEHSTKERYYIATMIPFGIEGQKRIDRHKKLRRGKGFVTIERPFDVDEAVCDIIQAQNANVLLECVSNLVANEMFERRTEVSELLDVIAGQIKRLNERVKNLYVVSNTFENEEGEYDAETRAYIEATSKVNQMLADMADEVIRV